jgi:ParB family chromosome partitioning protein
LKLNKTSRNLSLTSYDDIFATSATVAENTTEGITEIPLSEIDGFPNHPFQVKVDDSMQKLVDSIRTIGIQAPAVVRQKDNGRYELVSGHRRHKACELAGRDTMPCIVRDFTNDEAVIAMVEANQQREVVLPSEKAFAYKMRLDAMKRQAGRPRKNSAPVAGNYYGKETAEIIGEAAGESKDQVRRYIRLTELIPQLLAMTDAGKLSMRPAVEISYLPQEQQQILFGVIETEQCTAPSYAQSVKIRKFAEEGRLSADVIRSILQEEKTNQSEQFKIPRNKISRFFPADTPPQTMEDTIIKALELWHNSSNTPSNIDTQ